MCQVECEFSFVWFLSCRSKLIEQGVKACRLNDLDNFFVLAFLIFHSLHKKQLIIIKIINILFVLYCAFLVVVQVSPVECNGSVLRAKWNRPNMQQISSETQSFSVHVSENFIWKKKFIVLFFIVLNVIMMIVHRFPN